MEAIIEVTVIVAAVLPLARLCTTRPFLLKLRSFPATALSLAGGLVVGTAAFVVGVVAYPMLLRALAVASGSALLCAAWRARPVYGRARGLPPGSLGILPVGPLVDDRFFLLQAKQYGPVFKTSQFLRPMACVVGLERCQKLLSQYEDQLSPPALPFDRFIAGGFLRSMPAETHDRYAPVVRAAMQGEAVSTLESSVAGIVRTALDNMVVGSARAHRHGIAPRLYLEDMVFAVLLRMFFGITSESAAALQLRELYLTIDVRNPSGALRHQSLRALEKIEDILREQQARGAKSHLETEEGEVVQSNLIYIVQNARNDVAGLLVWVLKMLGDNPDWAHRLRSSVTTEMADGSAGNLAERIILETLRLEQSEFLFRTVQADIRCEGFLIPKGWLLRLCIRESHRSQDVFPQPDVFDPDRFLRSAYTRTEYSPFGAHTSRHICMGEHFTKRIGAVFLEELATGYEWRVMGDGPREFDGWHWTPGSRFRINVERATAKTPGTRSH